jgi:hypothetical protein
VEPCLGSLLAVLVPQLSDEQATSANNANGILLQISPVILNPMYVDISKRH